jgi:uncharacterized protein (DUF1499 family)
MMISDFPLDFARLRKIARPNQCLVLPAGFVAAERPDIVAGVFPVEAAQLRQAWLDCLHVQPRISGIEEKGGQIQAVQRTALAGFPDWITAQPVDLGSGTSSICIFSRSKYGRSDLGVNAKRCRDWLALVSHILADSTVAKA